MSTPVNSNNDAFLTFQLKGGLFPLTSLQLMGSDLQIFEQQLIHKIHQAPKFFHNAPVVIDLQKLSPTAVINFKSLLEILFDKKLIPVGVKGGQPEQQKAAVNAGLPILPEHKEQITKSESSAHASLPIRALEIQEKANEEPMSSTRIITEPVRSGQQIYVRGGDLIVLAPVSQGAELLADGNIHIYGPLRGRALAGVTGDQNTHIFCQSLEAELISIAGQYKISEDIEPAAWQKAVDICIQGDRLHIRPL